MKMAHIIRKGSRLTTSGQQSYTWPESLRQAWFFRHFRKHLAYGFATFSFYKKDGSIREARGTLFMPLIPADKHPKAETANPRKQDHLTLFTFFDLDINDWRSFDITHFIGFTKLYQICGEDKKEKEAKRKK